MAFRLYYNDLFPLRMINFVKKYLDEGGTIVLENRILSQLSKLQVLDYFCPGLFIREISEAEEASYNYETCYIYAPRKQGVLSNWGPEKQKINDLEDCLLGNSRNEKTYKNHTAAQSMLRRAVTDLVTRPSLAGSIVSSLRNIYEIHLNGEQKDNVNKWLEQLISICAEEPTAVFCTADRTDGFSFDRNVYDSLLERASSLYAEGSYASCWTWLCLGSLFGTYIDRLLKKYNADFMIQSSDESDAGAYRLVSSPSVNAKPGFCGRDAYLKKLDELFDEGNRVVFLYGIGGIGKTEIVRHYAAVHQKQYDVIIYAEYDTSLKDLVISEVPFETRPSIQRLLIDGIPESDEAFFKRKLNLIKKAADQRTLIIIDNFNTDRDEDLHDFLNGRYRVLITTQYDYSKDHASIRIREIEDMDTLIRIFMNNYQGYAVEKDDPDLEKLIRSVNCHTFTIALLAHHMENSGQTAGEMLEALEQGGIASLNERVSLRSRKKDLAYLNLTQMFRIFAFSEEEQKVLQLLAMMPVSGVPPMAFKAWADLSSTKSLLALEKRGWIIRTSAGIALHPVVQKVIRFTLPVNTGQIKPFLDHVADELADKNSWHYTKAKKEQYCLIARSILSVVKDIDPNTYYFYARTAVIMGFSGYPESALDIDKKLHQYCCENNGMHSFETARSAFRVGWAFLFNPHLESALEKGIRWLLNAKEIFDVIPQDTIEKKGIYSAVLTNLSKAYLIRYRNTGSQDDFSQAAGYAEQAVAFSRKWLSSEEACRNKYSPAGSLLRLADIKMELQEYGQAEELVNEAYSILTSLYQADGPKDPDILSATSRKATILFHLGKYEESLAQIEENLAAYQEFYGDSNASQVDQLELKIRNCIALGDTKTALKTKKEALEMARKIYSADSRKLRELNDIL
ncbi:MAG: ATP-binding protein [Solobacterium sp.]|nr:ATP-binding protein [Solobacterium sp.]